MSEEFLTEYGKFDVTSNTLCVTSRCCNTSLKFPLEVIFLCACYGNERIYFIRWNSYFTFLSNLRNLLNKCSSWNVYSTWCIRNSTFETLHGGTFEIFFKVLIACTSFFIYFFIFLFFIFEIKVISWYVKSTLESNISILKPVHTIDSEILPIISFVVQTIKWNINWNVGNLFYIVVLTRITTNKLYRFVY